METNKLVLSSRGMLANTVVARQLKQGWWIDDQTRLVHVQVQVFASGKHVHIPSSKVPPPRVQMISHHSNLLLVGSFFIEFSNEGSIMTSYTVLLPLVQYR